MINASTVRQKSIELIVNGIIDYIRLNLTSLEEDQELEQFKSRMIPIVTPVPIPNIPREHIEMISTHMTNSVPDGNDQIRRLLAPESLTNIMEVMANAIMTNVIVTQENVEQGDSTQE